MKLVHWTRFTWDLSKLPPPPDALEPHYAIRPAAREEEKPIRAVIGSALALDMNWSDTLRTMQEKIERHLHDVFSQKVPPCLVVTHGTRIIGASPLELAQEAECHLVTGPCLSSEYRNRGIGTQLLYYSLAGLRDTGLPLARGVSKSNVPVAKFVYTKFNSTSEPYEFEPELAD